MMQVVHRKGLTTTCRISCMRQSKTGVLIDIEKLEAVKSIMFFERTSDRFMELATLV